jgi:ethanolamine utilization microcompartment shell protein EutL
VRAAGEAILGALDLQIEQRLRPRVVSGQLITGVEGMHAVMVNRMRHGNFLHEGQALYVLETHPAGYALLATNEAEKAAKVEVLEFVSSGAFGRVYLGGGEEDLKSAADAMIAALEAVTGRPNGGPGAAFY